jgi:hypothetical protein
MAQASDYTGLITSEHSSKPKFSAMVAAVAQTFADQQNCVAGMVGNFDVDTAIGAQLDVVGLWVGLTRNVTVPSTSSVVSLDDATFRLLIKARSAANKWDGTPQQAAAILAMFYGAFGSYAFIQDNQDMSMNIAVAGNVPTPAQLAIFSQWYLPLKPAGVRVASQWVTTANAPIFGLDVENNFISGLDVGACSAAF